MKKLLLLVALISVSFSVQAKPVIFDTDMAIDDWAALLYLLHAKNTDVVAVTISASGESHCEPGLANVASLLDLSGKNKKETVIACGDDYPLDGYFVFPSAWRKDSDVLSHVAIPKSQRNLSKLPAADVIHTTILDNKENIIMVATGPLTNIAQWLERYPQDKSKIERLVIMGGTVDAPGNIIVPPFTAGHPNKTAEWNIFIDPVAADMVFASAMPITLVGLDVTNSVRVTKQIAADFKKQTKTKSAKFWDQVLDKNDWFIDSGEYYFWDSLAAMIAVDPSLCKGNMESLKVNYKTTQTPWQQTTDNTMPATRWDGKKRNHLDAETAGGLIKDKNYPAIKVCRTTEPEEIFQKFKKTLNR